MNNAVFCDVALCSFWLNDVSEERIASIFRVEKSESEEPADFSTLKMEVIRSSEARRFFYPKD
jgi:hypothetical protein